MSKRGHFEETNWIPILKCDFNGNLVDSAKGYTPQTQGNVQFFDNSLVGHSGFVVRYHVDEVIGLRDFRIDIRIRNNGPREGIIFNFSPLNLESNFRQFSLSINSNILNIVCRPTTSSPNTITPTGISLQNNIWYDITIMRVDGIIYIYVDNIQQFSLQFQNEIITKYTNYASIGNFYIYQTNAYYFDGNIDFFRLYIKNKDYE